jgi:hypothetical protein
MLLKSTQFLYDSVANTFSADLSSICNNGQPFHIIERAPSFVWGIILSFPDAEHVRYFLALEDDLADHWILRVNDANISDVKLNNSTVVIYKK